MPGEGIGGRLARLALRGLDALVSWGYGIWRFSEDPGCILRVGQGRARAPMRLSDGTEVQAGEAVGELHLWNERLPKMPPEGPDLAWATRTWQLWKRSLEVLAQSLEGEPRLQEARAFRGEAVVLPRDEFPWVRLFQRAGFDVVRLPRPRSPWERFAAFWENGYAWALVWTYNPGSLRRKDFFRLERIQIWISRERLCARYGSASEATLGEEGEM